MRNNLVKNIRSLNREKIKEILLYKNNLQNDLFLTAREVRNEGIFLNKAELRSVIEISNICRQSCRYCSMGKNLSEKYTLTNSEITEKILSLADIGRRTFLLQSGENGNQKYIDDISYCIKEILKIYPDIKIILCLGNLKDEQYEQLKESGARRYILKFETSNPDLHKFYRPKDTIENRLKRIQKLIDIGFQVGSGNIIGLPNQTLDNIVDDLILINELNLSMVSATKFIPNEFSDFSAYPEGDINMTLNFLAILRILKPDCLIPSTTSLSIGKQDGQLLGLNAGCNTITIHDGTPKQVEKSYSIYSKNRFNPIEDYCRKIVEKAGMTPCQSLI